MVAVSKLMLTGMWLLDTTGYASASILNDERMPDNDGFEDKINSVTHISKVIVSFRTTFLSAGTKRNADDAVVTDGTTYVTSTSGNFLDGEFASCLIASKSTSSLCAINSFWSIYTAQASMICAGWNSSWNPLELSLAKRDTPYAIPSPSLQERAAWTCSNCYSISTSCCSTTSSSTSSLCALSSRWENDRDQMSNSCGFWGLQAYAPGGHFKEHPCYTCYSASSTCYSGTVGPAYPSNWPTGVVSTITSSGHAPITTTITGRPKIIVDLDLQRREGPVDGPLRFLPIMVFDMDPEIQHGIVGIVNRVMGSKVLAKRQLIFPDIFSVPMDKVPDDWIEMDQYPRRVLTPMEAQEIADDTSEFLDRMAEKAALEDQLFIDAELAFNAYPHVREAMGIPPGLLNGLAAVFSNTALNWALTATVSMGIAFAVVTLVRNGLPIGNAGVIDPGSLEHAIDKVNQGQSKVAPSNKPTASASLSSSSSSTPACDYQSGISISPDDDQGEEGELARPETGNGWVFVTPVTSLATATCRRDHRVNPPAFSLEAVQTAITLACSIASKKNWNIHFDSPLPVTLPVTECINNPHPGAFQLGKGIVSYSSSGLPPGHSAVMENPWQLGDYYGIVLAMNWSGNACNDDQQKNGISIDFTKDEQWCIDNFNHILNDCDTSKPDGRPEWKHGGWYNKDCVLWTIGNFKLPAEHAQGIGPIDFQGHPMVMDPLEMGGPSPDLQVPYVPDPYCYSNLTNFLDADDVDAKIEQFCSAAKQSQWQVTLSSATSCMPSPVLDYNAPPVSQGDAFKSGKASMIYSDVTAGGWPDYKLFLAANWNESACDPNIRNRAARFWDHDSQGVANPSEGFDWCTSLFSLITNRCALTPLPNVFLTDSIRGWVQGGTMNRGCIDWVIGVTSIAPSPVTTTNHARRAVETSSALLITTQSPTAAPASSYGLPITLPTPSAVSGKKVGS